ncbi:hypothetical protein SAM_1557 [Streptococcus agalactiae CJB111]|nr:hypothetical protein SAM_1557 [Streptococcus agalactiae CJB111]
MVTIFFDRARLFATWIGRFLYSSLHLEMDDTKVGENT